MAHNHSNHAVTDEERRDFLKALGVGGAVAAGSATLDDVRSSISGETGSELAPIGEAIRSDVAAELDGKLLADQQSSFVASAGTLTAIPERGLPSGSPRDEFEQVATAARPVYDHLGSAGFFESTTNHLPDFTPGFIEDSVRRFVSTEPLSAPLRDLGFTDEELVDLVATVVSHRERIGDRHWVNTDQISREQIEMGEYIPPMTQLATGGSLLWFEDLDGHLWQDKVLITDEILSDITWHARSMAAGLQLVTEAARHVADESDALGDQDLAAQLSSGFALEAIGQSLLVEDGYWITEEMRAQNGPITPE